MSSRRAKAPSPCRTTPHALAYRPGPRRGTGRCRWNARRGCA
ncbi:hypothetical protein [Plasmodium yoelii yoelii]|uniref:Uncharacterized protein n=1 Tax=Plasmodium yoelii yoelii TaxID=73239 RepID=Q7R6Z6_PLAYO|nr:hypothetical protein [Plasmodium yoelii yoelii]